MQRIKCLPGTHHVIDHQFHTLHDLLLHPPCAYRAPSQVLVKMHVDIIPHLTNPHLLTDFLTAALDSGALHGILALHGIFTLVTKHGLEYPQFYRRLYNLLTPAALMVSHSLLEVIHC